MTRIIWDSNDIPIETANKNTILRTIMYEVDYQYGYTSSMTSSEPATNIFAQMGENENCCVFFLDIFDHRTEGKEVTKYGDFIVSQSSVRIRN